MKTTIGDKYVWTNHSRQKMKYYRLTESRIKRIIRHPARIEEGILENAIACMQPAHGEARSRRPAEGKKYSEIWAMYVLENPKLKTSAESAALLKSKVLKIITAWRYPGKSPERDPIPAEILREIRSII